MGDVAVAAAAEVLAQCVLASAWSPVLEENILVYL
jgi:hypothetical protein